MTLPTIHLNGTSAESLLYDYCEAIHAIRDAVDALCKTEPNGRDYYPQSPEALTSAIEEHRSRLQRLSNISKELETLAEHCSDFVK